MPSLTPLGRAPRFSRDMGVGDFEWRPSSYALSCLGAYDSRGYRVYRSLESYLRGEAGRHRRIWFHAGGLADFSFIIHWLMSQGRDFEIIPSGSAALRLDALGSLWQDSFFLLRAPLADLSVGEDKGSVDYETASFDELAAYNALDCRMLYGAIREFQDLILSLGGYPRSTAASTSLDLFRRAFQTETAYTTDEINGLIRLAYFASDVQPAARSAEHCYIYDITSSFPAQYRYDVPWRFAGRSKHLPSKYAGFGLATITVPRSLPYPPLPVRAGNGGIYFPTGTIHGWYSELDIAYASELGCAVKVHEWLLFTRNNDLRGLVDTLVPLRVAAKNAAKELKAAGALAEAARESFKAQAYKIVLNGGYGKFAERRLKERVLYGRSTGTSKSALPGIHVDREIVDLDHEQVHVSAWITAGARIALHRQICAVAAAGYRVFYWDTDSIFTDAPEVPNMGDGLGEFGRVGELRRAKFHAPKAYSGWFDDGRGESYLVKAKGVGEISRIIRDRLIPRSEKDTLLLNRWETLESGGQLEYPSMRRFRSVLSGDAPGDYIARKSYKGRYAKRCMVGDYSRPWRIEELP